MNFAILIFASSLGIAQSEFPRRSNLTQQPQLAQKKQPQVNPNLSQTNGKPAQAAGKTGRRSAQAQKSTVLVSKTFNLQISPFIALGMTNFEVDYAITPHFVGSFEYFTSTSKASSGGQADVTGKYLSMSFEGKYFVRPHGASSWFAGGGFGTYSYDISGSASVSGATLTISGVAKTVGTNISESGSGTLFFGGGGYTWFWENFNQQLSVYYVSRAYTGYSIKISNNGAAGTTLAPAALEYKLGWSF